MQRKWKLLLSAMLLAFLLCACSAPEAAPETAPEIQPQEELVLPEMPKQEEIISEEPEESVPEPGAPAEALEPDAVTSATPENPPEPVEPEQAVVSEEELTCTISISCAAILEHMDELPAEKAGLVPEDGWVLEPTVVTFYEGESVFNILQRTCKQNKIHLEFEDVPFYNSVYIEGIHNIYEFDCGNQSGWSYSVNGWAPNYGCSRYQLQSGDVVCWEYTCDQGADVNGYSSAVEQTET